jgi:hypothetical protein
MFPTQDREGLRAVFFGAWRKHRAGEPLEGIERMIVQVALRHPEYHRLLDDPDRYTDRDYPPEMGQVNPFLHMAMHIAIEESLALDEPRGIREQYQNLRARFPDEHALQHHMMDCLGEMLWQASRDNRPPDTAAYLDCLARLAAGDH